VTATIRLGLARSAHPVRLDESPDAWPLEQRGGEIRFALPAHALRTIRLR